MDSTKNVGDEKDGKLGIQGSGDIRLETAASSYLLNSPCARAWAEAWWVFVASRDWHFFGEKLSSSLRSITSTTETEKWREPLILYKKQWHHSIYNVISSLQIL